MYDIDVYGSKSIISLIEQSKHPKFRVHKAGIGKGGACVFDCNYTTNNNQAQEEFKRWADNIGINNNAYELYLFTSTQETQKKGSVAKAAVKFLFCLGNGNQNQHKDEYKERRSNGNNLDPDSIASLITLSIEKALAAREETQVSKRLKLIEERLEEEDDDEINGADSKSQISEIISAIGALNGTGLFSGAKTNAAINGAPPVDENKTARINIAIQRLYKIDTEIDSDLLKLADIGEKNPSQFKFLLNALRSM